MARKLTIAAVAMLCGLAWGQTTASLPATSPSSTDAQARLIASALHHQARSLGHLHEQHVPARAARIKVLLELAHQLDAENPAINRDLLELYESINDVKAASVAAAQYLKARPTDCAVFLRWMYLVQKLTDTAQQRTELLQGVLKEKALPEIHAAAYVQLAQIHVNQGEKEKALEACRQALELDPHQAEALQMAAGLSESPPPAASMQAAKAVFEGNPRDFRSCWAIAEQAQAQGLYEPAEKYFALCQTLMRDRPVSSQVKEKFLIDRVNALMDAGKDKEAIEILSREIKNFSTNLALRALLVEAYEHSGQPDLAAVEVTAMGTIYRQLLPAAKEKSALELAELAWFDLKHAPTGGEALLQARQAERLAPDDPYVQRVYGASLLAGGEVEEGRRVLAAIASKDALAAVELAKKLISIEDKEAAAKILQSAPPDRSGPGWRALNILADQQGVSLPEPPHAQEFADLAASVPEYLFEMAKSPEKFVQLKMTAPAEAALNEPLAVTVELKNISEHPVSLGPQGLLMPTVLLSIKAQCVFTRGEWPNLIVVPLPAPTYLQPGQSVSESVRIDVGACERLLARYALADTMVTATALIDPLSEGEKMISASPTVRTTPVAIRRPAFLDAAATPEAVQMALGYVVRDLQQGDLSEQMRAARRTGSLLAYVRQADMEKGQIALPLPGGLGKPVLLSMLRACLTSTQPAVVQEMLASLRWTDLDGRMMELVKPTLESPAPLARLQAVNLLAGEAGGAERLVKQFLQDSDPYVAAMAAAFAGEAKQTQP